MNFERDGKVNRLLTIYSTLMRGDVINKKEIAEIFYVGKIMKIKFQFTGKSVDVVLDSLPTAKVVETFQGKFIV